MEKNQKTIRGEISIMQTIDIGKKNEIKPIEWQQYTGENVCVNTTIRQGKRIQDIRWFEDKVKAKPRGNAYNKIVKYHRIDFTF